MAYERTNQWESMDLKSVTTFYETKFKEAEDFYKSHDNGAAMNADDVADFQARNAELADAGERMRGLQATDSAFKAQQDFYRTNYQEPANRPPFHGSDPENQTVVKTLGQAFAEHEEYKRHVRGSREGIVADLDDGYVRLSGLVA
jgi:hypothetical protein